MKIETFNSTNERRILIGMITNVDVLAKIASRWTNSGLFESKASNIIGGLAVEHYDRYQKAPDKSFRVRIEEWAETKAKNEDTKEMVSSLAGSLSDEFEQQIQLNTDVLLDIAGDHFNRVNLNKRLEQGRNSLEAGDIEGAEKCFTSFSKINMGADEWIDLFRDEEAISALFSANGSNTLIKYPDGLGKFFGTALEREGFVAFMAPDKTGKSFWLLDIAHQAMLNRKRVLFIECGDMSKDQIGRRFMIRTAIHPYRSNPVNTWPYSFLVPTKIEKDNDGNYSVISIEKTFDKPLQKKIAIEACKSLMFDKIKTKKCYFKIRCYPNLSLSVLGIKSEIEEQQRRDWAPDVVIIDYADNLAPSNGKLEARDQINDTWARLRAISQQFHCLVVTASQSDAEAYDRKIITRRNFSGDKRKLSHVTGMVGINCTSAEKQKGLSRLNWVVLRDGEFNEMQCCAVASCLPLANPAVVSLF